MTRSLVLSLVALAFAHVAAPTAAAQDKPPLVPLKLDLVISRQAGDKKISSMPYTMWLTTHSPSGTSLRMVASVPVPSTVIAPKENAPAETMRSYQYRDIGTNIDVTAITTSDGRYGIAITLSDTGINADEQAAKSRDLPPPAVLRSFTSRFFFLLRDGQTATYASATDPLTGETAKIEVTLTVLK